MWASLLRQVGGDSCRKGEAVQSTAGCCTSRAAVLGPSFFNAFRKRFFLLEAQYKANLMPNYIEKYMNLTMYNLIP